LIQELEALTMAKLSRINKPVKTKHLARSLGVSRPEIVQALNALKSQGLILWMPPSKTSETRSFGWKKAIYFDPILSEIIINGFIIRK